MSDNKISVLDELMLKKGMSYEELFYNWLLQDNPTPSSKAKRNRLKLSPEAAKLVNGAYTYLTGMELHVTHCWLAESMTEAICCAEALGL